MTDEFPGCGRIFDDLYDGLYIVNRERVIRYWNRAAERISGYSPEEVKGSSCRDNILRHVDSGGLNLCEGMCPLAITISDGAPRRAEVFLHHRDGDRVPVELRISAVKGADGGITGGAELFSDINARKTVEARMAELEKTAMLDGLTGLLNRRGVERELFLRFEEYRRYGAPFGVIFMDIDRFKRINDLYGHEAGDRVLKMTAGTLLHNLRPLDAAGRWGGEEFICILRDVTLGRLEDAGNRLRLLVFNSYIMLGAERLSVSVSAGAAMMRQGDSIDTIVKRADALMYRSKRKGRNRLSLDGASGGA